MKRDPNHIAIFDHIFYMGGVERVFIAYAEILIAHGHTVDLVVSRASKSVLDLVPPSVNIVQLGEGTFRQMPARLRRYLKTSTAGTLITGNELDNFAAILTNLSFAKKNRVNLIVSQHSVPNDDDRDAGFMGRLFPLGKRWLYRYADSVISVSKMVSLDLEVMGVSLDLISEISNPIDIGQISQRAEQEPSVELPKRYIAAVARLHRVKNIDLLLYAFERVDIDDMELVIVGDGPLRKEWEAIAKRSKKSDKIHFTGTVTNSAPIIARAEVVAVTSTSEAFPMTIIEALALGRTVVSTPNFGALEICGAQYEHYSWRFDDPEDFATALRRAIQKPIDRKTLIDMAMEYDCESFYVKLKKILH